MEWVQHNKLIEKDAWAQCISELQAKTTVSSQEHVKQALVHAIQSRIPTTPFGIFLSGGVDSSLIAFLCKQYGANPLCVSVGMQGSPDVLMAKKLAEQLKLNLITKEFTISEAEALFKKTVALFPQPNVLSVGVGAVVVAAAELGKTNGITTFFGGLGSEEIFAGYERHAKASDVNQECWKGLHAMWERDLVRDYTLGTALGIQVLTPFLDEKLIIAAMGISGKEKINEQHKKLILRKIAEELGLPQEFSWRKKQAAQYGSKFDLALEKLAKRAGLRKEEYVKELKKE